MAAAALLVWSWRRAAFWIVPRPRPRRRHPVRVAVQPFETLSDSEDARSLARRIPNEVVNELGDSQIETVLAANRPARTARSASRRRGWS